MAKKAAKAANSKAMKVVKARPAMQNAAKAAKAKAEKATEGKGEDAIFATQGVTFRREAIIDAAIHLTAIIDKTPWAKNSAAKEVKAKIKKFLKGMAEAEEAAMKKPSVWVNLAMKKPAFWVEIKNKASGPSYQDLERARYWRWGRSQDLSDMGDSHQASPLHAQNQDLSGAIRTDQECQKYLRPIGFLSAGSNSCRTGLESKAT